MRKWFLLLPGLFLVVAGAWSQTMSRAKSFEVQGDTLMRNEQFAEAAKLFTKSIEISGLKEPGDFNALYKRAVCYYQSEQFDNALKDLEQFIPNFPNARQPYILRALIYREMDEQDKVLEQLEQVTALGDADPRLTKWKASLLIEAGRFEQAKRDLLAVRETEDDAETETYLAFAYFNMNQPDSAILCINKSIELDVTYAPAYLYAGTFLVQAHRYDEAITYLNLALRLDPNNANALFYKGAALIEQKKTDAGCSCLSRSFYLGNDDAQGYLKEYCYDIDD
ncbi:MAG: tetratricopeptide repeat protein [Cyclobacteriaceae bacterium]|nr:tetratricopeptide repeat protein [Cyclobacteriaceae bacterium]